MQITTRKTASEITNSKRDELEERLVAARCSGNGATAATAAATSSAPPASSSDQPARASGMVRERRDERPLSLAISFGFVSKKRDV